MKIKEGAKKEIKSPITEIKFTNENRIIQLWINGTLSYLSLEEAAKLKWELDEAIEQCIYGNSI